MRLPLPGAGPGLDRFLVDRVLPPGAPLLPYSTDGIAATAVHAALVDAGFRVEVHPNLPGIEEHRFQVRVSDPRDSDRLLCVALAPTMPWAMARAAATMLPWRSVQLEARIEPQRPGLLSRIVEWIFGPVAA